MCSRHPCLPSSHQVYEHGIFSRTAVMEPLPFQSLYLLKPLLLTDHEARLHLSKRNFQHYLDCIPSPIPTSLTPTPLLPTRHHLSLSRDILLRTPQVLLPLTPKLFDSLHCVPGLMSGPEHTRVHQITSLFSKSSGSTRRD